MLSPKEFSFHQCCSALKKGSNLTVRSLLNTGPEETNFRRQEIALWVSSPLPIRTGVHRVQVLHAFFTRAQWLFSGCLFNCRMYIWRVFHKWHLQQLGECPFSLLVPHCTSTHEIRQWLQLMWNHPQKSQERKTIIIKTNNKINTLVKHLTISSNIKINSLKNNFE